MHIELKPNERIDDLQCRGYNIIQNPDYFCFGMDAVLLADFASGRTNGNVIDLGTGTGVIPILMKGRGKGLHFTGLELQEYCADMASRSVSMNALEGEIDIMCGDIRKVHELFQAASFDVVTSNPPYINQNSGILNINAPKNIARHEVYLSLEELVKAAAYLLKEKGTFSIVHKPFRLTEIISVLQRHRLEPKRMTMVQPYADKEPNMVLIESVKGGRPEIKIEPTLVVYNRDGSYTEDLLTRYGEYH